MGLSSIERILAQIGLYVKYIVAAIPITGAVHLLPKTCPLPEERAYCTLGAKWLLGN
jgi:hypothetical protein